MFLSKEKLNTLHFRHSELVSESVKVLSLEMKLVYQIEGEKERVLFKNYKN